VYLALEVRLGAALAPLLTALRLPLRPPGARGSKLCTPAELDMPAERVAVLAGLQRAQHMQPLGVRGGGGGRALVDCLWRGGGALIAHFKARLW
jgi:hypothetical protein